VSGPFTNATWPAPFVEVPYGWYVKLVVPAPSTRDVARGKYVSYAYVTSGVAESL
jgi:hypothetical protein